MKHEAWNREYETFQLFFVCYGDVCKKKKEPHQGIFSQQKKIPHS